MTPRTRLDKTIAALFPGWALRRTAARHNLSVMASLSPSYQGNVTTRRRPYYSATTAREDTATSGDYSQQIAAAMQLYRNDPMTGSIVDTVATYMGESHPTATTNDAEFNAEATDYFNQVWWGMADARRRPGIDFGALQTLWSKWCWVGGDMLYALHDGALYPYEGLQIATPAKLRQDKQIVNGVRVQKGAPHRITHYYVVNRTGLGKEEFQRIRWNEAIYAPNENWRTAMLRSVPALHRVIDALQDWDSTNNNMQGLIDMQSRVWTVERKGSLTNMPGSRLLDSDSTNGTQTEYSKADWGARFRINGDPDKDFKFNRMDNPSQTHVPYMEYMARVISAGCGLPMEMVLHLFTNGSYTANRAARCDFAKFVMGRWGWRNKVLNQRVWNWVIAKAIKENRIRPAPIHPVLGNEWHKCSWTLPHFPQIDEGKEITADIRQWGAAVTSLSDLAQERGITRQQLLDAHDADIGEMQERAATLGVTLDQYAKELFTKPNPADGENPNGKSD